MHYVGTCKNFPKSAGSIQVKTFQNPLVPSVVSQLANWFHSEATQVAIHRRTALVWKMLTMQYTVVADSFNQNAVRFEMHGA